MRVALFITCFNDTLFPEAGRAVVEVLERVGCEVEFPLEQTCCGQMHMNSGYPREGLALAGRFLMARGINPATGRRVVSAVRARRINALMLTCGHYDGSGEFAFRVGLPGKSGVGGGILAIAPGQASIAVWSPGINASGNSQLGMVALERLAQRTGWSVFHPVSI